MELQQQIEELQATVTDRGLVMTLEDSLFASGKADLKASAVDDLSTLIAFLHDHPARTVVIEGHTDSLGGCGYNHGLSQRRADAVRSFLVARGIGARRIIALGKGESDPVASNQTAAGRECNRRIEVIIDNPPGAFSQGTRAG
jgi:outer membrane protein OmpA-like peptidoglycan-associated protein